MFDFIFFILIAYLLGSIPTAVWLGKIKYGVDVREHGSKNAGATNTFRVLGKKPGIVVLLIDVCKGVVAVLIPLFFANYSWGADDFIHIQLVAGLAAVLGHVFPLFAQFNGGKGVATSLGIVVGIHPLAALTCFSLFLVVFLISAFVSLGAITAALAFPFVVHFLFENQNSYLLFFSIFLSVAVIIAHHKNIGRLLKGQENKMNLFNKKP